jgi:hypothetical protein
MGGGPDKVQREIEELLDRLDNFVPEERLASKIRNRRRRGSAEAGPGIVGRAWKRVARISLGQIMLAGMALLLIAILFRGALGPFGGPLMILGLVMAAGAFLASAFGGGRHRTVGGGSTVEKRWRGQVIDYSQPSAGDRLMGWFRRRRR